MIVQIDDWRFRIFDVATRKHTAALRSERCECSWCRNYYGAVEAVYPELQPLLARFHTNVGAPEELMNFDATTCAAYYTASGSVVQQGSGPIHRGSTVLHIETLEQSLVDTDCPGPVLCLYVECMKLPWILPEPVESSDSPARGRNWVQRLLSRYMTN